MEEEKNEKPKIEVEVLGDTAAMEPITEAPAVEPASEAPVVEPVTEAPAVEIATEAPTTAEPVTEAPTTAEPVTEAPATAEPATEAPKVEEKKEKEKKKSSPVAIILIIVALLIGGGYAVWYYVLGGNGSKENKEEPAPVEPKPEEPKSAEIDVNSDEVTKALENFSLIDVSDDELTQNDSYDISSLTLKQKVETLGKIVANKDSGKIVFCGFFDYEGKELTIEEINSYLQTVLNTSITQEELDGNKQDDESGIPFVSGTESYFIKIVDGKYYLYSNFCDGLGIDKIVYKKAVKAEKNGDNLLVYEKRAFYSVGESTYSEETETSTATVSYYKDYAKTELIEALEGNYITTLNPYVEQNKEITWDKYNTYKYTFKIVNGNYYFEKYELSK